MAPDGLGVCLFTYSLILTRGIQGIAEDMDALGMAGEPPSLIGRHDYAAQELVNLLLFGRAHSNVFDGRKDMGGDMVLRGVPDGVSCPVGMLTLFEHYGHVRVGRRFKEPEYPVWVLCSESHYSVLFTLDRDATTAVAGRRDFFYYDELGKQEELYRLTVDCVAGAGGPDEEDTRGAVEQKDGDLTPPIEHVIRTRWKGAAIDWNGAEALL